MTESFIITQNLGQLRDSGISRVSAAIGVFDGVHLGHQRVLKELVELAVENETAPVVITFYPHPRSVLTPEHAPRLLFPQQEKARLIHHYGAAALVRIPFTKEFASLSPDAFLDQCLNFPGVELKGLCVGSKWRFGCHAAGSREDLMRRANQDGFQFRPVDELMFHHRIVSSTAIRGALAEGDLEMVTGMLGRRYRLFGSVVHGMGLAGKILNAATANLELDAGVLPPYGVYATLARVEGEEMALPSITSIGVAPTIRKEEHPQPKVEVHVFDRSLELYGKRVSVELVARVRGEQKFDSVEALKKQIHADIAVAAELLKGDDLHG